MRTSLRYVLIAGLVLGALARPTPSAATCEVPLALGNMAADANVLILFDTSGSMNEALQHPAYNKNTRYSGNFDRNQVYSIDVSGSYTPRSFRSTWPNTPSAYLVASDGGQTGDYDGNYLNWVYFHANATQRGEIPTVTRIQAAKPVVAGILGSITTVRFALEKFNGSNGGTIVSPFGTPVADMQATVMGFVGDSWTPLAESMITAKNYFSSTGAGAPITSSCQKNFIIVVTDGMPTQDDNMPSYIRDRNRNGYYLDDVALYMYRNDMRSGIDGIQNVATFTIGFNIDDPLLQLTADNGGGEYFTISDAAGLQAALQSAFNTIAARVSAGAAVSVVASEDRTSNRLFRARYESQSWKGYLESFNLPFHAGSAPLWESGSLLQARAASTRTLYTSTTGTNLYPFTTANASTLMPLLGAADVTTATNIITYTRGDSLPGTRSRYGWKLGDIVDAAPVAVGRPNSFNNFDNYWAFRAANTNRSEVVYVGSNDGLLHAFDANNGVELWAYAPKTLLSRLSSLMNPAYCHEYFLNMTPVAYDIFMNGAWKTVIFGGSAQGGSGLFAIDITRPAADSISVLWDLNIPALHGSWNGPALVRDRNLHAQVLAVGTGYEPSTNQTNLLTLDPTNGSILSTLALGSPVAGNKTTKAVAVDRDYDDYDDLLYIGDLAGNIWRVDVSVNPWTVTRLFSCGKPIQATPSVTLDALGRVMLFFGTGRFINTSDLASTSQETIYGIIDDNSGATLTPSNLVNQTTTFTAIPSNKRGWYINLSEDAGERVTRNSSLISGTLYVPSFRPNTGACTGGGQSWLYTLDFKDGSAPDHSNGTANNVTTDRVQSMGDGILADPSVDLASEQIIFQSSNAVLLTESVGGGLRRLMVRSWRQRWN